MNQGFKLRFDQLRASDPTGSNPEPLPGVEHHSEPHSARTLCLIWPDGRRIFFNYAYLVAGTFEPHDEANRITLEFSSHEVLLKGYGLEALFVELLDHSPRLITATELRYAQTAPPDKPVILEISVKKATE